MPVKLPVGDPAVIVGIVALPDDGRLVAALLEMAVYAVEGDVGAAVLEPFDRHVAGEGGVLDLGVRLEPVDPLAVPAPEPVGIADALGVPFEIGLPVDVRVVLPRRLDPVNIDLGHDSPFPVLTIGLAGIQRPPKRRMDHY